MTGRRCLVLLCLLVLPGAAVAEAWPVPRGPSREPVPFRYDARIVAQLPRDFLEDADACILYSGTTHLVDADGTTETISHEVTRLNSRKGIERLGEYHNILFDPQYEKLTLNEARVIKADGTIVPIEARHVHLRDSATDYQVYDPDKQLIISFPNLEVGDVYEVRWTVRGKNPEFGGEFFTRYTFGDDQSPVVRDELHVRLPSDRALRYAAVNGKLEPKVSENGGERHYHWETRNRPALPRDEDRPSKEELRLQVACSTFRSWEAVAHWKQKLRAECWTCTPEVRKVVREVTQGLESPVEKARALTYWVRRHIRYVSRGPGGLGYTPHLPQHVLGNLYGDCKDQAQLLAVMLREVGLEPWLVTLGPLDDGQVLEEVPSPWGTHAILLVPIAGKDYWIDTTLSHAGWDFLPRSDRDRLAYLTRAGELKLQRTPPYSYRDYRFEQTTHVAVAPDGSSRCRREAVYHGSGAYARRENWLDAPPGERRRLMAAELQDSHSKVRLRALTVEEKNLLDYDAPVKATIEFEIPRHFTGENREGSLTDSLVWNRLLGYNLDSDRAVPMLLGTPLESKHRYLVELPLVYQLDTLGEDVEVRSKWGFFRVKMHEEEGSSRRLTIDMHFRLENPRIEKADFAEFQQFHDEVHKVYRVWLGLKPTQDLVDAPALEKFLDRQPRSEPHTAKVLARLYLEHDRTADARRVLERASPHYPDDRGLWELRVQAADGEPAQEELYRAMVQRFPGETKYSLALARLGIERGDHETAGKILTGLTASTSDTVRGAAHYQLARSAFRRGQPRGALKHLEAAEVCDPTALKSADAQHFRARVHEKLGEPKEAIEALRSGLALEPQARALLVELVRLEQKQGLLRDAVTHLLALTVAAGDDAAALVQAAELHLELGRLDDAYNLANRALVGKQARRAHRVTGLVRLQRQEYREAELDLRRAEPDERVWAAQVQAYLHLGRRDSATSVVTRHAETSKEIAAQAEDMAALQARSAELLKATAPDRARAIDRFVCVEYGLAHGWPREQVEALVREALTDGPELGPALALRGWLALERGQLRLALADAERALAAGPEDFRGYLVRGRVRLERGQSGALADLEKAAALSQRRDAFALHWLAAAQLDAGHLREAQRTQQRAAELRPLDPQIQEQRRQIDERVGRTRE